MTKKSYKTDVWVDDPDQLDSVANSLLPDNDQGIESAKELPSHSKAGVQIPLPKAKYSLEGLRADFPTSRELQQFVYDETGVSLKLFGLDPNYKYELALRTLIGDSVDSDHVTDQNPYVDNTELIPEDPIKPIPERDPRLPKDSKVLCIYHDMTVPHPDRNMRALDAKVICQFKTYENGAISYEIMGPLEKHAEGEKLDKYGRARPAKFVWVDPRTGEQGLRYADGSYSQMGQRLRTLMESKRVNAQKSVWSTWIDRDFTQFNQDRIENPWD